MILYDDEGNLGQAAFCRPEWFLVSFHMGCLLLREK